MAYELERLQAIDLELPPIRLTGRGVVNYQIVDDLLFIGGVGPLNEKGELEFVGTIGRELTVEDGCRAARLAGINVLQRIKDALGGFDRVEAVLRCYVCVAAVPGFGEIYQVADGFSDVLTEALGARGVHARNAMGAATLEGNSPVLCDAIVQIRK